jgi:dCMP deaminase
LLKKEKFENSEGWNQMIVAEEVLGIKISSNHCSQKWDERFLGVAREISSWSKDPSTKVGSIAVSIERKIIAQGYNGFPAGCDDSEAFYNNRETKYARVIHAETNVICNACNSRIGLHHATVYIYGMYPCPECVKLLSQVGIARIVFQLGETQNLEKWKVDFEVSKSLMRELHIGFTHYSSKNRGIRNLVCTVNPEHIGSSQFHHVGEICNYGGYHDGKWQLKEK